MEQNSDIEISTGPIDLPGVFYGKFTTPSLKSWAFRSPQDSHKKVIKGVLHVTLAGLIRDTLSIKNPSKTAK